MAKKSQKKSKVEFALEDAELVDGVKSVSDGIASAADALAAFDEVAADVVVEAAAEDGASTEDIAATEDDFIIPTESMTDGISFDEAEGVDTEGVEGTELDAFASAEVEDIEEVSEEKIASIVESLLFSSDKPQSVAVMKAAFAGTKVRAADIRAALEKLQIEYSNPLRGVELAEVANGYQLRTKPENAIYLQRTIKARPFKLSGPALEVLSIVAYKQPTTKSAVDDIRGVESGHLMRGLLERGLIHFGEKSDLPGRPMYYETSRKFLETFGLRSLQELPTLNEIDQLIPEGIDETTAEKKQTLSDLTGELSEQVGTTYSEGEQELQSISSELQNINLTTAFFDDEKKRQREKRDLERAQEIRERLVIGEEVATRDKRWLERYENPPVEAAAGEAAPAEAADIAVDSETTAEVTAIAEEVLAISDSVTLDEDGVILASEPSTPESEPNV